MSQLFAGILPVIRIDRPADVRANPGWIIRVVHAILPEGFWNHLADQRFYRRRIDGGREGQVVHVLNASSPVLEPKAGNRSLHAVAVAREVFVRPRIEENSV